MVIKVFIDMKIFDVVNVFRVMKSFNGAKVIDDIRIYINSKILTM